MLAELTDQKQLSTVIDYLRNSNAAEELLLDEVETHRDVLASDSAKKFISTVPSLLEFIGEVLSDMLLLSKDIAKNGSKLIQEQREDAEDKRLNEKNNKKKDNAQSGVSFGDLKDNVGRTGLMALLGAGTFLIGSIVGSITQLATFIKASLGETVIGEKFKAIIQKITSIVDYVKDVANKSVGFIKNVFTKLFSKEKGIFKFVGEIAEFIGKGFKFFSGGAASGLIDDFGKLFSKIAFFFKIGKSFGAAVVKLLGKIAVPLTIIMAVWDSVTGAIEGYQKEGIAGAFKGGISGLLNSLIGSLLDLLKDGVSWLLGALGFDQAEQFLDSFSFTEYITNLVNSIVDGTIYAFNWIKDKINETIQGLSFEDIYNTISESVSNLMTTLKDGVVGIIHSIGEWFKSIPDTMSNFASDLGNLSDQLVKTILQNVLPRKDPNGAWYSPMNLAAAAIPASVYEYAGMNPDTGEVIKNISAMPNDTSSAVSTNPAAGGGQTIVNNISRGGDVNNVSNSNVNQNVNGAAGPILTGSAMGLYSF